MSKERKMTKEQRKAFEELQSFMEDIKQDAIKNKDEFSEELVCSICDKIIGYGKDAFIEALCNNCYLTDEKERETK